MSHSTRTQDVEISNFRNTECDGVTSSQSQASQGQISESKVVSLDRSRSAGDLSPEIEVAKLTLGCSVEKEDGLLQEITKAKLNSRLKIGQERKKYRTEPRSQATAVNGHC